MIQAMTDERGSVVALDRHGLGSWPIASTALCHGVHLEPSGLAPGASVHHHLVVPTSSAFSSSIHTQFVMGCSCLFIDLDAVRCDQSIDDGGVSLSSSTLKDAAAESRSRQLLRCVWTPVYDPNESQIHSGLTVDCLRLCAGDLRHNTKGEGPCMLECNLLNNDERLGFHRRRCEGCQCLAALCSLWNSLVPASPFP